MAAYRLVTQRTLGEVELRRYLDYSCELLALVGKVAALYAEGLADPGDSRRSR